MALESDRSTGQTVQAEDINQFKRLLTGQMSDQPVAIANSVVATSLTVVPASGPYTPTAGVSADLGAGPIYLGPSRQILSAAATDVEINAATVAVATNGGEVYFPPAALTASAILVPKANVSWLGVPGATSVKWTAAAPGSATYMVDTGDPGAGSNVSRFGIRGISFDTNNKTNLHGARLVSWQFGFLEHVEIKNPTWTGGEAFRMDALSGSSSVNNTMFNRIRDLKLTSADIMMVLSGVGSGAFTTDNTFDEINGSDIISTGIRFVQWCDSQIFNKLRLANRASSNTQFLIFNDSATPAADVGVYDEQFYGLFVDGSSGGSGQAEFVLNWCYGIKAQGVWGSIGHGSPGTLIQDNHAQSYHIEVLEADTISGSATQNQTYVKNSGHMVSSSTGTPASSALATNVTSITVAGDDNTGTLTIVLSGAITANASLGTITFANSYGATAPFIQLTNHAFTTPNTYVLAQTTGVSFTVAMASSPGAGTFVVKYSVIGKR